MPTNTYTPIGSVTLATATSEVTFTVPTGYRDLVVAINGAPTAAENISLRFNGDSANNYSYVIMYGTGSAASSGSGTQNQAVLHYNNTTSRFSAFGYIFDASATDKHKTVLSRGNQADGFVMSYASRWANTAAITSVTCLAQNTTFTTGTTLALYGIVA